MIRYLKVVISQPVGQKISVENEDDFKSREITPNMACGQSKF